MRPELGCSKPANMRSNVDFPQPELPSKANISWRRTERLTDCTATVSPNILTTSSTRTNSSASPDHDGTTGRASGIRLPSRFQFGPHAGLQTHDGQRLWLDDVQGLGNLGRRIDHG